MSSAPPPATVLVAIPVAALIGETIAWQATAARNAVAGQDAALAALAKANITDDLTGVGNRRRANALLDSLDNGDALVILDLDHFTRVNDVYGHHVGDEVLQDLGAYLLEVVRGEDRVARYGGEEFIVVLRDVGPRALFAAQRMLSGWADRAPLASLSAGVALKRPGQPWSATFVEADAALYQAKADGRARAVLHSPATTGANTPAISPEWTEALRVAPPGGR
jgi:diguanylate cyclase (GGDEF)-like protein